MAEIISGRSVSLSAGQPVLQSAPITLPVLTDSLTVILRRPTTAAPLAWNASAQIAVSLIIALDGVEYLCSGSTSGGVRVNYAGEEIVQYRLSYRLPVIRRGGRTRRLGEDRVSTYTAMLRLERLRGNIATEIMLATTTEADPPVWLTHNSVAFDAATDAQEAGGDGVISLSHTSGGSNRGVFAGVGNSAGSPQTATSITYGGTSMTELWDIDGAPFTKGAGYRLAGQATGAQTVTATLAGSTDEVILAVVSMTGVDQTTPVGTPVSSGTLTGSPSVTVGSIGSDDLIVDFIYTAQSTNTSIVAEVVNQIERTAEYLSPYIRAGTSTQPGTAGGVMSWTVVGSLDYGMNLGAVAFKPAAASGEVLQSSSSSWQNRGQFAPLLAQ